ncbi:MAG: di-heme oxidoredictase family protein [Myxococcota bacterium]
MLLHERTKISDGRRRRTLPGAGVAWGLALGLATPVAAITTLPVDLSDVEQTHGGQVEHCDEAVAELDFLEAFECGDELFEVVANAVDGVGANVGDGGRFTRGPRADLDGPGEWADHFPARATGPNAAACVTCHVGAEIGGGGDGSGPAGLNVMRDPLSTAFAGDFIQRNTPHLFGPGALQRLAEEMTVELRARRDAGIAAACDSGAVESVALTAKGVEFGTLDVDCGGVVDASGIDGVDADLLVRPFQWKGTEPTVRSFSRGAQHNELGLQPVELVGDGIDGDGDGVVDEMTIADVTAMAVYLAGQPRPVSQLELNQLRLQLAKAGDAEQAAELGLPELSAADVASITRGEETFVAIGCADCHRPALVVDDPVFSEPSAVPDYRDDPFPAGQPALAETIRFDLTEDLPDNQFTAGRKNVDLGNFERHASGGAIVRLYGDLRRHDMGPGLAENVDESGHGASVWMTKELWGVGATGQYLHDGRATTLTEAILEHGGEAVASRNAFAALSDGDGEDVVRFLENLVVFFPEEEDVAAEGENGSDERDRSPKKDKRSKKKKRAKRKSRR